MYFVIVVTWVLLSILPVCYTLPQNSQFCHRIIFIRTECVSIDYFVYRSLADHCTVSVLIYLQLKTSLRSTHDSNCHQYKWGKIVLPFSKSSNKAAVSVWLKPLMFTVMSALCLHYFSFVLNYSYRFIIHIRWLGGVVVRTLDLRIFASLVRVLVMSLLGYF